MTAKRHKEKPDSSGFAANPFGELGGLELPAGPELPEPEPEPAALRSFVVRRERKGRRGKEVTVLEADSEWDGIETLARDLKQHLGVGGTVRERCIELQGDQRALAAAYLRAQSYKVRGEA